MYKGPAAAAICISCGWVQSLGGEGRYEPCALRRGGGRGDGNSGSGLSGQIDVARASDASVACGVGVWMLTPFGSPLYREPVGFHMLAQLPHTYPSFTDAHCPVY